MRTPVTSLCTAQTYTQVCRAVYRYTPAHTHTYAPIYAIHLCTHTCKYIPYTPASIHTYTSIYTIHIHTYTCTHPQEHTYIHTPAFTHMYTHLHIPYVHTTAYTPYTYICPHALLHILTCTHICIHRHIHTHKYKQSSLGLELTAIKVQTL